MLRLPRLRDLDPDLQRRHLPFFLRGRWLLAQFGLAIAANIMWALFTIHNQRHYRAYLEISVAVFVIARLGSRFLGVSLLRIRQGKEHIFDSRLGKATMGGALAVLAVPQIVSAFVASELLMFVPFYSGAVVGMAFSFFLWAIGLPR